MASSTGHDEANSSSGVVVLMSVTTFPMKTGIITSISATAKPAANSAINGPFAWRAKYQ